MPNLMQLPLFDSFDKPYLTKPAAVLDAVEELASHSGIEARGAVFTRVEVVEFILDLAGYTEKHPLCSQRILEPSFGGGDFLLPIIERLLSCWRKKSGNPLTVVDHLGDAIRAFELHRETFIATRQAVLERLQKEGIDIPTASSLADRWLVQGDFLLEPLESRFDYVVGNPPYVRQELIPMPLLIEYRRRYRTIYDRADLYIPFIERSLSLLKEGGNLGYICADRWMKNRYGGPLRRFVANEFHLKMYVDMVDTDAFHTEVSAYPAIIVIGRERPGSTRISHHPEIEGRHLAILAERLLSKTLEKSDRTVRELACVANGAEPWLLESSDQMSLIRQLEKQYPTLELAGCKVGIGVATGADKAFIGDFESLDVEPDRKLPLATTRDIQSGEVAWNGLGVVNPFAENGGLVDLAAYPMLSRYLEARKDVITTRHCARKAPANWYRTIDRIWPALAKKPKLLIPDIKGEAHIVYEPGRLYPHHNLYYVISEVWDLRALQAVLLSSIAKLFVATYATKMRGGYLRFQAQYLRRIRLPLWQDVPEDLRQKLCAGAIKRDIDACNAAAFKLYKLTSDEQSALGGTETTSGN